MNPAPPVTRRVFRMFSVASVRAAAPRPSHATQSIVNKKDGVNPVLRSNVVISCYLKWFWRFLLFRAPRLLLPVTISRMNPAALFLASGDSLYPGALLLGLAVMTARPSGSRRLQSLHSLAIWLGFSLIVMASPPVSGWMAVVFLAAFFLWFVAKGRVRGDLIWTRLRVTAAAILLVWLLAVPSSELLRRRMPRIHVDASYHLVVIGDSISSGIDAHTPAWPTVLQRQTGVPVQNLSRAGAGIVEARAMASRVQSKDTLILIEIGGNDLLSGMSSAEFGQALESLLSSLSMPGRTLVMFELPLLPHKIGFGQMQRRLSTKYGVFLVPKHFFTRVLGGTDATSDGLHLSESGARQMATLVAQVLCLQPARPATRSSSSEFRPGIYPARRSSRSPAATAVTLGFLMGASAGSAPITLK